MSKKSVKLTTDLEISDKEISFKLKSKQSLMDILETIFGD